MMINKSELTITMVAPSRALFVLLSMLNIRIIAIYIDNLEIFGGKYACDSSGRHPVW